MILGTALAALDVFSGIGGFARALKGIASVKTFCDVDPVARGCLVRNMERGLIEKAPIEMDIRTLKGSEDIDLIAAGVPCLGFSPLGLLHGFEHIQTKLFFELLRVVDECKPSLIFLENVPNIVVHGMHTVVEELHERRGYDLLWVVLPAYAAGASHTRMRWFCLARKPGMKMRWDNLSFVRHEFSSSDVPPRMIRKGDPLWDQRGKRCGLLGNTIVPCVARMAFFMLASGFRQSDITAPMLTMSEPYEGLRTTLDETQPGFIFPRWGGVDSLRVFSIPTMHFKRPSLQLTLTQKNPLQVCMTDKVTSKVIFERSFRLWSTPRAGNVGASRILTERSSRDLPTQVKFEASTPDHLRDGQLNPDWVEVVLMGYPQSFTRYK
jgi:hypothetical protein